jgi:hypothetical protein
VPVELGEQAVREELAQRLAGPHDEPGGIVWVKDGDEVVVWLDSLRVELAPAQIRVRVDLETDQTGRDEQEVVIALAPRSGPPSLLAVAADSSAGGEALAARWGRTLQDAVWGALLDLADERAGDRATGIAADDGTLVVHAAGGAR